MSSRLLAFGLAVTLSLLTLSTSARTYAQTAPADALAVKVKADVAKRAEKNGPVSVKLRDGSKLKGTLSQVSEDGFTLTDSKSGQVRTLTYTEVASVKGAGGLSRLAKIGIGLGIAGAVAVVVLAYVAIQIKCNEGGCP